MCLRSAGMVAGRLHRLVEAVLRSEATRDTRSAMQPFHSVTYPFSAGSMRHLCRQYATRTQRNAAVPQRDIPFLELKAPETQLKALYTAQCSRDKPSSLSRPRSAHRTATR
jgi:hypothetical protein